MGDPDIHATRAELAAILRDAGRKKSLFLLAKRFARGNETPDDLINSACVKLLSGKTPWRRSVHADLVEHLGSVMSANASNARTSADARRERKFHTPEEETRVPDDRAGAEEQLLDDEAERRLEQRLGRWLVALRRDRADDGEAMTLLDSFERGVTEAAAQVVDTGWSIDDVRRVRRRIFDRAEIVLKSNPDDSDQYLARGAES